MAAELTELESRLFEWLRQSDFHLTPWSTEDAAQVFEVEDDVVYEAIASLTKKVPERIQVFYKNGSLHIAVE